MSGAAVQTLTSVPKVLFPFLGTLVTLALPSDVSQSATEMPYHLLYAMMMMVLFLVFVGRTRRRRRRRRFTAARCPMMMLMVIMMRRIVMAVTVNRVVRELMMIGRVGAVRRAVGRGTDRAAGYVSLVETELAVVFLAQQLLQKPCVVIPDVRRRGGGEASGIAAVVVGAVMMRQKMAYSVHFTRRACREQ